MKFEKFLSTSTWNFEKIEKLKKLLQMQASFVKIQIIQYVVFFNHFFPLKNEFTN